MHHFVLTCENFQVHSGIRHRDELHRTYLSVIHFKWKVNIVTMLMGVGKMRYFVLAKMISRTR